MVNVKMTDKTNVFKLIPGKKIAGLSLKKLEQMQKILGHHLSLINVYTPYDTDMLHEIMLFKIDVERLIEQKLKEIDKTDGQSNA